MRILWQNVHYPDITLGGGGARNSRHITAGMRRLGHEVTFVAEARQPSDVGVREVFGANVYYYPKPWLPERLWLLRDVRNCLAYPGILSNVAPGHDAYFCNDPEVVFALARHALGMPVVCRVEGTRAGDRASWRNTQGKEADLKDRIYSRMQSKQEDFVSRMAWRRCSALLVKSALIKDELVHWYGIEESRIAIIPNGVDFDHYAQARISAEVEAALSIGARDEVIIGFVGRLSKVKNLEMSIHALAGVRSNRRVRLVVVGEGEERENLLELARSLGVSDRVTFVGHKEDVAPYLASFDIFVMTSLYETIANCLLEAMSAGLPCVTLQPDGSRVRTSSHEVIQDGVTGFLVGGDDPAHLSSVLTHLIEDAELRCRVGHAGQVVIKERFDWVRCAQQYVDLATSLSR